MASIPLDTVRKTRGKSPLRAISPARLHDLLSLTPKNLKKATRNEKTIETTPARKMLQFDESTPTAATPVSQVGSQKLYEQLNQHFRAFTGQLLSVQRKMCDVLRACGKEIEQSDLAPHVLVTHQYAFANQESNPHSPLMRAYTLYTTRIQPLLLQASAQARAPYNKQLRNLAAALFLSGHHYKGLLMLKDILTIFDKDLDIECAYQKWCVLLAEWEVLNEFYDEKNNLFTRDKFVEHTNFASICQQIKVFHVDAKFREHSIQQLYQYLEERKDEKTFANYELMALINSCLANAYKLQRREVKDDGARFKTKDGLVHLEQMLHCSEVIVKNMARNLLVDSSTNYELPLFDTEGKDSGHILKVSLRVSEHFYFVHQYVLEMFKSGQTREACYASLKYWIASLRLGLHPNIVRASSLMFWVRFASFYDSHSRPNMRKILQHLYSDSVAQPEGEMKTAKQGVADMTMGALTDTFLELYINEDDTSNPTLHLYAETCSCSNCGISRFDPVYRFEWHIFAFAYDGFPTSEAAVQGLCEAFTQLRSLNTPTQQKLLGHLSKPRPPLLMSMLWMLVMIQWLRYNDGYRAPRATTSVITTVSEWTKKIYKYASSFLQAEFLALAQASRPACPPLCYSWMLAKSAKRKLLQAHPKTTEDGELVAKREKAVEDARKQYALHKHLMYRDWRLPICSMIAQLSIYPWESAMMSAEMCLLATRQAARAIGRDFGEEFRSASQFQAKVEKLPEDITVLQLVLNNSGDFVVVKLHCSRPPVIVPIASKEKLDEFIKDMAAIMRDNDTTGNLAKVTTDSKYFWKERRRVDDALRVYCAKVQNQLLGPFAMLFRPSATLGAEGRKAAKMIQSLTTKAQTNKGLSSYIAAELVSLFATGNHEEYETLWKPLIPAFCELNGELGSAEAAKVSRTNSDFYVQLKKAASDVAYSFPRYTMIVASPELSIIPWESLPIFEKNPYIGRFGSVHKLLEIFEKKNYSVPRAINPTRGVFICDPDNNLDDTKKRMCDHMAKLGWTGIVGRVPDAENFKSMLSGNDIYVYLGHGSGSKYFGRTAVRKSGCQAVGFLMGCSSVAITPEGPGLDGRSSIYDYFIADSPCVVGCLWMVTDGEIDRYFIDLSDYMFDAEQRKPKANDGERLRMLMDGMAFARSRAKLRHLTGASVVSYGIPVVTSPSNGLDSAAKG